MNIGIDLGGSHIGIGLVENGEIIKKVEHNFSIEEKEDLETVIRKFLHEQIDNILKENNIKDIEKVGIAVPGRPKNGYVIANNIKDNKLNLENIVREKINKPVYTKNDGMCAGIAEFKYGNLKDCNNGVFLGYGTGIGTAVFINRKLIEEIRSIRTYDY